MKRTFTITVLTLIAVFAFTTTFSAQTKAKMPTRKALPKKTETVAAKPTETAEPEQPTETTNTKTPVKKNERPETTSDAAENSTTQSAPQKKNQSPTKQSEKTSALIDSQNVFSYEFSQPNFVVSHVVIEHDENGKGTLTFEKKNFGEAVTDPIQLSSVTLEKVKSLFETLNFLDSTEEYQSTERQYAHLGTMKIRMKKGAKERTVEYNWTENKDAKALVDEYRRISQQFVWIFDITVSRENQPLEAPSLMDALDSLIRRNEISDPSQLVPLLKKLSNDERIPLIARNHATRIVKEIEKPASK
jgi:hypothetical protein